MQKAKTEAIIRTTSSSRLSFIQAMRAACTEGYDERGNMKINRAHTKSYKSRNERMKADRY